MIIVNVVKTSFSERIKKQSAFLKGTLFKSFIQCIVLRNPEDSLVEG